MHNIFNKILQLSRNPVVSNSYWGGISLAIQGVLLSLFFIIIARYYPTEVFADFIIANVLYQLISAFSTLGLSQWFIREITGLTERKSIVNRYFKLQIWFGFVFYLVNISLGYLLYNEAVIRQLTIFFGINIIFDNLINAIKCINISEFKQKKTFIILSIEAALKFSVTCLLFIYPLSIVNLTILMVLVRFLTLNLFLNIGSSRLISFKSLFSEKIGLSYIKNLVRNNWPFIIIGSISIINWRISTLIISKFLTSKDVADFEISFRLFSLAQMLPVVVSTTVFPILVNYFKEQKIEDFSSFYRKMHLPYFLYSLVAFTFIYSFIDYILPLVFGLAYSDTGFYTKQMFITILVFPTAFLQANVIVSMKLEKIDMWLNVLVFILTLTGSFIGLLFYRSMTVINLSIFFSFMVFHIFQNIILVRRGISTLSTTLEFYALNVFLIGIYIWFSRIVNPVILFTVFWFILAGLFFHRNKWEWISRMRILTRSFATYSRDDSQEISATDDINKFTL
ncbi:MAG TPA: oligosaccharide flippase family protein [Bacteroidales bacterium]|nr:oligosaccharide flippase family protein [Bacteroidales bacterium]